MDLPLDDAMLMLECGLDKYRVLGLPAALSGVSEMAGMLFVIAAGSVSAAISEVSSTRPFSIDDCVMTAS